MAQVLGIVDCVLNGKKLDVEKGATFKPGGLKNTPVVTGRKLNRSSNFEAGEVSVTMTLQRGQRLSDVATDAEQELQILCDTGQSYTWSDAFQTELLEVTGGEGGKIKITWAVGQGEELLNG